MRYVALAVLILAGCGRPAPITVAAATPPQATAPSRFEVEVEACKEAIRSRLLDPDSARFESPRVSSQYPDETDYAITVNAKNSLGGYAGRREMFCVVRGGVVSEVIS